LKSEIEACSALELQHSKQMPNLKTDNAELRWYDSMNIIIFDNPHKTRARCGCPSPPPPPLLPKPSSCHRTALETKRARTHTVFRAASRLHSQMAEAQRAQNTHGKNKNTETQSKS
jgi:hypothetical protein